jgi:CheY-like chemotaxis protein
LDDLRPTILIADDNPEILRVVAGLLRSSFTVVGQAEDGEAALRAITELRPLLAVLDLSMPKIDGMEVARRLKKGESSTKVVFLTLLTGEDYLTEARRYGHGYVTKTRLESDLCPALNAALQDRFFVSDFGETR